MHHAQSFDEDAGRGDGRHHKAWMRGPRGAFGPGGEGPDGGPEGRREHRGGRGGRRGGPRGGRGGEGGRGSFDDGPGFEGPGPDERGQDFDGRGPGFEGRGPRGPRGPHGHRGHRGRGRAQRGDVRTAILQVVAEEPMHGYQIMQAIAERTNGAWKPSPGAVYPTINQLEDEGLVTTSEEGGRRLVSLTDAGGSYLEENAEQLSDPFANFGAGEGAPDLRGPLHELHLAARQIVVNGDKAQVEKAQDVLATARRSLYLILAGESDSQE